jgi:hypothetical protein
LYNNEKRDLASFVLGFWTQRGLRGGSLNGEDCKLCKGDEMRGEHQLHFIETFRESETKLIGYERRVSFEENHKIQSDMIIKKKCNIKMIKRVVY